MKKAVLVVMVVLITAAAASAEEPYGGRHHYMSFALGGYGPSEDLNDEGYKSGGDFNFSYMHVLKGYFGFGGGVHFYGTESSKTSADIGDGSMASFAFEGLFYVQPNHWRVQPYIGIGPALYFNALEYKRDVNDEEVDESGVGFGGVLKLGVRAFITKRFFGGIVMKGFSNQWNVDIGHNKDKTYDFGGGVLAFELGFTF